MQRNRQRKRNRDASDSEVDHELDAQPEPSQAQQNMQASGEARWARHNNNTWHVKKCKLHTLLTGVSAVGLEAGAVVASAVVEARLDTPTEAWVKARSMRALLGSVLLGLMVRSWFTRRTATCSCKSSRGLPPVGEKSRPSAAVEAVLAAYPGLHARLNAVSRFLYDSNTVDDVGTKLETSFANSLTELFPGRLEQAVALAGAKVIAGSYEHQRRFGPPTRAQQLAGPPRHPGRSSSQHKRSPTAESSDAFYTFVRRRRTGAEASPLAGAPVSTGPTLPPVSGASPLANLPGLSTAQTAALVNQLLSKILAAPEALALFKPVEDAAQAAAKAQPPGTTAPASYVDALLTPPPANTSTAHAEEAARLRLQLNAVTASMEAAQTEAATLRNSIAELDRIHGQADAVVSARLRTHVSRAATLEAMPAAAGQDLRAGITPMQPDAQHPIGPGRLDLVPAQVSRAITAGTQATSACRLLPVGMVMVGMVLVVEGMVARVVVAAVMVVVMVVAVAMEVVAATHPGVPSSLTAKCELLVMPEMFSAFDVLMGSNWLTANGALLDYLTRTVTMQLSNNSAVLRCQPSEPIKASHCAHVMARHGTHTISASRAASWLRKGGHALVAMISAEQLNTPDSVPPVVSTKLKDLINEYSDVFAPFNGLPPERPIGHTIPLQPGCKPPALPAYRMTQPELAEMKKQITAFLAQGIIEPSSSPYAAPVLFVKKKSGELRMCVDYRQLNKQTLRDQYPLPRIDDLFDKLAGCTVFSSLDLQAGYHQIRIPAEDVPKTAFRTPDGHYQYKVLCFGLTNAPATFQRVMNDSFADVINDCALVYLDDILVMSKTVDEHFVHLRRVLDLLRKHKFFAKLSKCEFMKTALKFLGHIVSDRGVAVDPDKIQSITTWPVPNSLTALQRFLGAANFVRKFVHNFSALAAPLTDLTGKEGLKYDWKHWPNDKLQAFHALKHAVSKLLAGYRNDPVFADISITDTYDVDEHGLYHTKDKKQIVVPDCPELRARILLEMHDAQFAGHVGITKTLERISRVFWWPRMRSEVRHYVANCDACQRNKSVNTKPGGLLMPLAIPYDRWESITMDLITKLPTGDHGYDAIAVFVDRLSKMVHFVPCKESMNAKGFARLFIDNVFKHHGVPREIISDRGSHFTNQFWSSILKLLGVKECKSSAYHPESDGQTERYNRTLEEMMRHYISPAQHDWPLHLALAEFAVNNSWQESIQSTPFLVNTGQSPLTPTLLELPEHVPCPSGREFSNWWQENVRQARHFMDLAQRRQAHMANKGRKEVKYVPGDLVLLSTKNLRLKPGKARKLLPRFVGPFKVLHIVNNVAVKLDLPPAMSRLHPVFHVSLLRKYTFLTCRHLWIGLMRLLCMKWRSCWITVLFELAELVATL
ncbi:hypothetical protein QJQ45_008376 [Haematococcus lacustris]|nr:hypothetical protein QJQ45_008376 [Haematococcus lacustris]